MRAAGDGAAATMVQLAAMVTTAQTTKIAAYEAAAVAVEVSVAIRAVSEAQVAAQR